MFINTQLVQKIKIKNNYFTEDSLESNLILYTRLTYSNMQEYNDNYVNDDDYLQQQRQ